MSRMAQVIVWARYEDEVMEPLTRPDEARTWHGCFVQIRWFVGGWHIEFERWNGRRGVLKDLESLPWNDPACVQVMLHDEDDDLFGLWMFRGGSLVEVDILGTQRVHIAGPPRDADPGFLVRTGLGRGRTGTRQSTYKTRGRTGDPVRTAAGHMLKSPLPVQPGAGPGKIFGAPVAVVATVVDFAYTPSKKGPEDTHVDARQHRGR
ncbi:hypothetical protein OG810_35395 [Streptomyces sp. NBC_01693]|uniref:hypothetical protein n=1 Tax=unclassified Streptomyces TaxID=2593676 RepID=UPI0029AE730E|nr:MULTISPECIES: hypothetical protein [unclassified Streptomyces]MDX3433560.1 hypothetical protein [Streptomyces sp. ME01-18a]MDX3688550.1 hypothetical protein [Streptomyces sp. AK04-4c]